MHESAYFFNWRILNEIWTAKIKHREIIYKNDWDIEKLKTK